MKAAKERPCIEMNKEGVLKEKKLWLRITWMFFVVGIILSIISIYLILNEIITIGYSTRYQSIVFNSGWLRLFLGITLIIGGILNIRKTKKEIKLLDEKK
ncbi:MAG: hypothetical protein HYR66_11090 [Sphingobacteriales bacterium]|nr:hypothetical protein [Sphingobacteriales bacterium]MBI3720816.1 hypothetical protein [Sphingobacteriales bacterium]